MQRFWNIDINRRLHMLAYSLVFLGMLPTLRQGIGGAVVVVGVLLLTRARSLERDKSSAKPRMQP